MILTDPKALKILNKIRLHDLIEDLEERYEDEPYSRSDMEILLDEINYFLDYFEDEEESSYGYELANARYILKLAKKGKEYPISLIDESKEWIAKYKQLKYYQTKITNNKF